MDFLVPPPWIALLLCLLFLFPSSSHSQDSHTGHGPFIKCLRKHDVPSHNFFTCDDPTYNSLFFSSVRNRRTLINSIKPLLILFPSVDPHVQAAVHCSRELSIPLRTRSGGHDYEGLSYASTTDPFVLLDLQFFNSITIDMKRGTAWVQAGASLGELYHAIAQKSNTSAFPAGLSPTIGVGGHLSGGGLGTIIRSFGLAADNVIDVRIVVANGAILNRKSMGEDLFWALSGGGGASFGVILAYRIRLVKVPPKVTVFTPIRTLEEGATELVNKWQHIAYRLDKRLFISTIFKVVEADHQHKKQTIQVFFNSLFLGEMKELLPIMEKHFPELRLKAGDCMEVNWIESVLHFAGYQGRPLGSLLKRWSPEHNSSFKHKSDFLTKPIPLEGLEAIWRKFLKGGHEKPVMIIVPWGGRMDEISATKTAFPHRKGTLYNVLYLQASWKQDGLAESKRHIDWIRSFYKFMAPYVSKNPRAAYSNYRDLDLGRDEKGIKTTYWQAKKWGETYFKGNFRRLAYVKAKIDPNNMFRNEQSIPPLFRN